MVPPPDALQELRIAVQHHQSGRLNEAESIYKKVLEHQPNQADALHLLGVIEQQRGKHEVSIDMIRKAIQLNPGNGNYYNNLGVALRDAGKAGEAVDAYKKALEINPSYPEAYINMGMALKDQDKPDEAIACYHNLLKINPNAAEAHNSIGLVLKEQGKTDEAIAAYRKALEINPNYAEAHVSIGNALKNQGRIDEALNAYRKALEIRPDFAEAYNNMGNAFRDKSMAGEAIRYYRKAVGIRPNFAEAYSNMGVSLNDQGIVGEAVDCYRKALEIKPQYHQAHSNLLFTLQHGENYSPEWMFEQHRQWDEAQAKPLAKEIQPHINDMTPGRRLRIGYVSPDFRRHSCAYFIEPLLRAHDKTQVEIFCYSEVLRPDDVTQRIRDLADHWYSTIGRNYKTVAEQIRADRIDILVDLAGHTENNRLLTFAYKPAPVQVTWLGYPDTTGMSLMDYRFTDDEADPEGIADRYASETLIRLPNGFLCYSSIYPGPAIAELPFLKTGKITFGSFNNLSKATEKVVQVWSQILQQIPDSLFFIKSRQSSDDSTRQRYLDLFARNGISAERITMTPRVQSREEHLSLYNCVDIALDPFPYNGTTTTFEALWMGVPVVTLRGTRHVSRVGASILKRIGLSEFVAETESDYIDKVLRLAGNIDRLKELRSSLRGRLEASPLCDAYIFARSVENVYRKMWAKWCGADEIHLPELPKSRMEIEKVGFTHPTEPVSRPALRIEAELRHAVELHQGGNVEQAEKCYRKILEAEANHADALHLLGVIENQHGRHEQAVELIRKAILLHPERESYYSNMGNALKEQGKSDEAILAYQKAVELKPDFIEAYNNLGVTLKDLGRFDEAIACYSKALTIRPDFPEAYNETGIVLKEQGRDEEAVTAYKKAVELRPNYPEAYNNMGIALQDQGNIEEAVSCYRKALEQKPDFAEAYNNLGNTLKEAVRLTEAFDCYKKALEIRPGYAKAHSNLLGVLQYGSPPPREWLFEQHCKWDEIHAKPLTNKIVPHSNEAIPERRLRVGYFSPDFCRHSCAYFIEPLLRAHDKRQVEIFCYSEVHRPDELTERIRGFADHWYSTLGKTDADVADQIRKDRIDILVDMAGHFARNRLLVFAHKPAPIQVTWLGYPDTTGMSVMDYRFSDAIADPEGISERYVRETLVRLPGFLCYNPLYPSPAVMELPLLKSHHPTFGSFNNLSKVNEHVVTVWSKILQQVPYSRILLKSRQLSDRSTQQRYLDLFLKNGVTSERVKLMPRTPSKDEHLALYGQIDIALDPFPYNGTTTTCEALWMGVPVITMAGDRHVSRVGASILTRIGLRELISEGGSDYIAKAVLLAGDMNRLVRLRTSLRGQMQTSPFCDAGAFARSVEAAYREMWGKLVRGSGFGVRSESPPVHFQVPVPAANIENEMSIAVQLHQAGDFDKAETIYKKVLAVNPNHPDALHLRGVIAHQTGKYDDAVVFIRKAVEINPNNPLYYNNLGASLKNQGKSDEAIATYHKALALHPDYPEAYNNLGNALKHQGKLEEAVASYKKALEIHPGYAEAYNNMGNAFKGHDRLEEAVVCYQKAIEINPNYAEAYYNMGGAVKFLNRLEESVRCYEKALEINPNYAEAYNNMGVAYKFMGNSEKSVECYKKALEVNPNHAEAYNNLGIAMNNQGRTGEAIKYYSKAMDIRSNYAEAHNNMGYAMNDQGRLEEAAEYYRKAVEMKPDYNQAHSNLLFTLQYGSNHSPEWLFGQHREWNEKHAKSLSEQILPHSNEKNPGKRLRVGYVSPDFRGHSCAYFIEPLLRSHDKTQVEVFCYSELQKPDEITNHIRQVADHWYETSGKSDAAVAEQIRADQIDILVDLAGHTANNRLLVFARKPAPIQINWLGYPDTTGMDVMDYRLTDSTADPEGMTDRYFTETLTRLPQGFLCYAPLLKTPDVGELPFLKTGSITFGSFNNLTKVTREVIAAWSEILLQVPGSRLLLKSRQLIDEATCQIYHQMFSENGIPAERVSLMPRKLTQGEHLDLYNQIDVGLDPFPYNGTTTTCEALWMGVPVITLCGVRHVSRVGASILTRVGLTDLIADSRNDYIAKAVHLSRDIERLKSLRATTRQRMMSSPLCNAPNFARSVEAVYRQMWLKWCSGDTPTPPRRVGETHLSEQPESRTEVETVGFTHPTFTVEEWLAAAVYLHQSGQVDKAGEIYGNILASNPNHPDALHFSGVIAHQSGRNEEAVNLIRKAMYINPGNAVYYNNIAAALNALDRKDEAIEAYRKAIELDPAYIEAYCNLGNALRGRPNTDEMLACYRKVVELDPNHSDVYNNLGNVLNEQGKSEEAIECYKKALEIRPDSAEAHNNLGLMLTNQNRLDEAVTHFRKALELKPDYAEAYNNLGNVLNTQNKPAEAIESYKKALEIKPDYGNASYNMGNVLNQQARIEEAVACYRKALEIHPDHAEALNNMANGLKDQSRLTEAIHYYEKALEVKPDYHQAHSNLLFTFQYQPDNDPAQLYEAHLKWGQIHAKGLSNQIVSHSNDRDPDRRLRIGYVSPDFRSHSCAYFIESLLREHDRHQVELFCYSEVEKPDEMTEQLKKLSDHWISTVGKSQDEVVGKIREDHIDILVDLAGHTANNRLLAFACKPAPVQVTWIGYPDTTGLVAMDYRFTDAVADPEGVSDRYVSEKLVRLPHGFLCYAPPITAPAVGPLPFLKSNTITFASFNNLTKVTEKVVAVWSKILQQIPRSRLLLKSRQMTDEVTREYYYKLFSDKGIPRDRVAMQPRIPSKEGHLALYNRVDIALDPFPYNGTTTTCEALWMGVPVITLCGNRHVSRVGTSILTQVGLTELITQTEDEYIARAVQLAGNTAQLSGLRSAMRQFMQKSSLCDGKSFARDVETAYREMWKKWVNSQNPAPSPPKPEPGKVPVNVPGQGSKPEAERYNTMASTLKHQGKLNEAIDCYRKATELDPKHIGAYYNMGNTFIAHGKLEQAVDAYRKAVEINPNFPEAYNNMGVAFKELGKAAESLDCYRKAIATRPNYAEAYNNMGNALKGENKPEEAIACYKKALEINPKYLEACYNMGNTLSGMGKLNESIECYRKVLEMNPNHPESYNNMGNAYKNQGKPEQAIECYQKAIAVDPKNAEAYYNMANTLNEQGKLDDTIRYYRKAVEIRPNYPEAYNNLGAAFKMQGKLEESVEAYKESLKLCPNYAEACNNMGLSLYDLGRLDEAAEVCRKAIQIKPDYAEAYNNLAGVLKDQGKLEDTIECYRKALKLNPNYAEVHNNLGNTVKDMGNLEEAVECYRKAMSLKSGYYKAHSNLLFALQYGSDYSADWIYEQHCLWDEIHAKPLAKDIQPHLNERNPEKRIRVGYISPDFRKHSCAYFIEPLLNSHDRTQVEIFCYSEVQKSDEMTERVKELSDHWYSTLGQSDAAIAEQIRKDRIDILVDLAGHTANNRLLVFAYKPAPVQVNWLGYPDTTGLHSIDYRFTDAVADPEGIADKYATEMLVRLPNGFHCYSPLYVPPEIEALPFLKTGQMTFVSFNNLNKVTEKVAALWSQILHQVPNSRIVIKSRQLATESVQKFYLGLFAKNGIPAERVTMMPRTPTQKEHLSTYNMADIALDPFPYNGTTTSFESLWMGVPFITLCGKRHVGRVGASILTHVGLTELIAADESDYVAKAVQLAGNIDRLQGLRSSLRQRMINSPICDEKGFARSIETAYREMWRKWCKNGGGQAVASTQLPAPGFDINEALNTALRYHESGQLDKAEKLYKDILAVNPNHSDSLHYLGFIAHQRDKHDLAVELMQKAVQVNPRNPIYYNNMGVALNDQGKTEEAVSAYRNAIELRPDYAEAHNNLGNLLNAQGRLNDAIASYRKALEIRPDYAEAYNNMGVAFKDQGKLDESIECCRKTLAITPNNAEVYSNMGNAYKEKGELKEAVDCYQNALKLKPDYDKAHSNLLLSLQYDSKHTPEWLYEQHREWNRIHAEPLTKEILPHANDKTADRRLRIGYVSPDFRRHSCAYIIESLFKAHDKKQVEIFCYADVHRPDDMTRNLQSLSDQWRSVLGKSYAAVAEQIRNDHIDILVDLAGHTAHNRLLTFARKPAPVQVTWLGYPDTTGMDVMDYRLSDSIADPEGISDNYASESLLRLPQGFLCYAPPAGAPPVSDLPFLKSHSITFASFNNLSKTTPEVVALWSKILHQVPGSRILLKNRQLANDSTRGRYLHLFADNGIAPERITMMPYAASLEDHLKAYHQADIALDPFPYNGTITSCEALWMGIPMVTLCGNRHASRVGASILTRVGLPEFIAETEADYIQKAVRLAGDIERMKNIRASLRNRMQRSPLCDAQAFARTIESVYQEIWGKWVRGEGCEIRGKKKESFDISKAINEAIEHHKAGRLDKAESLYQKILLSNPNHPDALYYLGFIAYQSGKNEIAADYVRRAIQVNPRNPVNYNMMGILFKATGRFDEAVASYKKAIEINPNYAEAFYNMGNALNVSGRSEEAVAAYRKSTEINPNHPEAYNNMGAALKDLGRSDEAIDCYKKALKLRPEYSEAYNNMGAALKQQERTEEAFECYRKAIALNPNNAEAHYNYGNALKQEGRLTEAIACYETALKIRPNNSEAYHNMGNALKDQGRLDDAMLSCRKAVEINPKNAEAHNSMGVVLNEKGKIEDAAVCYQNALANRPDYPEAHNNIGNVLKDQGRLAECVSYYIKALEIRPGYYQANSNLLFTYQYGDERIFGSHYSSEWLYEQHRIWDERHAKPLAHEILPHSNEVSPNRRLRIGYVSPDFHRHSCAYFITPLFRGHDKTQVEIFCYAYMQNPDEVTEELKQLSDHWRNTIGKSHKAIAEQIRSDKIDILIDLAGHSANDHLMVFARKPAPVQVTWLGYPGTTGMSVMDYRLTDAAADPEDQNRYFSETIVRLPGSFLCYSPLSDTPDVGDLPALKFRQIAFASFNNSSKVNEHVISVWSRILQQVPGSELLLKSKQLADEATKQRYLEMFLKNGISSERISIMSSVSSRQDHLNLYNQVDIALDPFPYNGTTTSCEALWMGVPVITLCGKRHVSRVGTSILTQLGLPELIASDENDYIAKTVQLAGNIQQLAELRAGLRQRMMDKLCNAQAFARSVESAYREMWKRWCRVGETHLSEPSRSETKIEKVDFAAQVGFTHPTQVDSSITAESSYQSGNRYRDHGNTKEAIEWYKKAVEMNPNYAEAYNNMGNMYKDRGEPSQAIACYKKTLEINPNYAPAYNNLGLVMEAQERIDEAVVFYREALKIAPDYDHAISNLIPQMQQTCDWKGYQELTARLDALTDMALKKGIRTPEDPFTSLTRHADPARNFAVAKSWIQDVVRPVSALNPGFSFDERKSKTKITVGYISKDFRNHPVSHLMLGLFGLHNRDEFNVFCYSYGPDDGSEYRQRIQQDCDKFVDIRDMGHSDAAKQIYSDKVDILVDLMGFTGGSRLVIASLRPAPIQATYLGFPGTTAADFFDYIITDKIVTPEHHAACYTEKFAYLPHFQVNDHTQMISDKDWKNSDFGLPDRGFIFCSFNQAYKIEPIMFDVWMKILLAVPGSVLWLAHAGGTVKQNLRQEAEARGVNRERLVFAERLPSKEDHLARQRLAGLALDTRIYNGHTTTTDALWAGVPVITLQGSHYASRASSSILTAIGMPELIAHSLAEYEQTVVRLATQPDSLRSVRQKLVKNRITQPLFNTPKFVMYLEKAYKAMWEIFLAGEKPREVRSEK